MTVLKSLMSMMLLCTALQLSAQIFQHKATPEELYKQAVREARQQHYDKAIELSQQALSRQPDFIDQQLLLGKLYLQTKQYDNARKYIQQVLTKNARYRDAYSYAINIELSTGHYDEALRYTEQALTYFPGSKELMLKKLSILDAQHKVMQADNYAGLMFTKYPTDTVIRKAYIEHHLISGRYYKQTGNTNMARKSFDRALEADPLNDEAKEGGLAADLKGSRYTSALEQVNSELSVNPNSYNLLMRKLGILQDMHAYTEALSVLQEIIRKYPGDSKARSMENSLRMEAAQYYTNADPYSLYQSVYERSHSRDALDKLIGHSMARGSRQEAMDWINQGLRSSPNDHRLLALKTDMLEEDKKYSAAAELASRLYQQSPNPQLKERLVGLQLNSARDYLADQQYEQALTALEAARKLSPNNTAVLDLLANTYLSQKDSSAALDILSQALAYEPDNERLKLKKSSLLAGSGRHEEAATLMADLATRNPDDPRYKANLADIRMTNARALMQSEDYDPAKQQLEQVLALEPTNKDALNYMINLQSATGHLNRALLYANKALEAYPDDRDLLLKKSSVLYDMKDYAGSSAITQKLMDKYPYTVKYKNAFMTSQMAAGRAYQQRQRHDSALIAYNSVLALNPKDTLALLYCININNEQQDYDVALAYAGEALHYYPRHETFLLKRANTLENKKDYVAAALAMDSVVQLDPSTPNRDYLYMLESKTLKNQFALYYLNSSYDFSSNKYNIATVEYRRYFKRGSYAFRVNYAGRQTGNGIQGEAELYYTHRPSLYSYGLLAYSNYDVFPKVRAAYSIFKTFHNQIEVELGARYLNLDSSNSFTGVTSVARPFGDFWVNLRAYFISESSDFYTAFNLTTRYYMNNHQDFVTLIAGIGTSPDDRSRLIRFPELSGLLTHSVGTGYQKVIRYRTTVGLFGTWINQKITNTDYQNQYDIYLVFQRKF